MTSVFVTSGQAVVLLSFLFWGKQPLESWRSSFQDINGGESRWLKVEASPEPHCIFQFPYFWAKVFAVSVANTFGHWDFTAKYPQDHTVGRIEIPFPVSHPFPWGLRWVHESPSTFLSQTERTLQGYLSPGSCIRSAESFIITASQLIFSLKILLPSLLT